MKVTIRDMADELGLSPSTISRALKNDRRISEKVRHEVRALAKEMGYRPNLLARGLRSDRSHCIGLIINDLAWSFFSELGQHIQNAAEKSGYTIFLYSSCDSAEKEKLGIERMVALRNDGLIVYANESSSNIHVLEHLVQDDVPVVLLNNMKGTDLDIITVDDLRGTHLAMRYLFDLGHHRIAYIGPTPRKSVEKMRIEGYEQAYKERAGAVDRNLIFTGQAQPLLGYYAAKEIIELSPRPTAIVAYNDNMAMGVIRAVLEAGLTVPGDISVIGFDGLELGPSVYPPLTTVSAPIKQIANMAVEILLDRIDAVIGGRESDFAPQHIELSPQLVLRASADRPRIDQTG